MSARIIRMGGGGLAALLGLALLLSIPSGVAGAADKEARVARAMFTTQVEDREPTDQVLVLDNSVSALYFFSDLRHMQGQTVTHRWEYEGKTMMTKSFDVGGPRWRVYSKKDLEPGQLGQWTVVISNEKGWPLKAVVFRYVDSGAEQEQVIVPPEGVQ